jgi:SAM-dependent methyltransferase
MASPVDMLYLETLMQERRIQGPVLDLGSRNVQDSEQGNSRALCEKHGIVWEGADVEMGRDVSFVLDVLDPHAVAAVGKTWQTVIASNLFEHVYDPIRGMENALSLVAPGGACVIITPTFWELHDYPADYWRPLPDFYIEFAKRHGCTLQMPRWMVQSKLIPWDDLKVGVQKYAPSKGHGGALLGSPLRTLWSRIIHRALRTNGREMFFPYSGVGVCLTRI